MQSSDESHENGVSSPSGTAPSPVDHDRIGFQDDAANVLNRLRSTLVAVLDSLPERIARPAELQRALGIDFKLSCKILKVIGAPGPMAAGPHVPGASALKIFLNAANKAAVPSPLLKAVSAAAGEFERMIASHAGDRTAFDSMISSFGANEGSQQITTRHRRAAFRAQSHILGLQARVQLKCMVVQPATDPNMLDLVRVTGFLSLRQLRPNAPLIVPHVSVVNDDGSARQTLREPLDDRCDPTSGVCLLHDFCSRPLPQFRNVQPEPGTEYGELVSNGVGMAAAISFIEGHVVRGAVPRYADTANRYGANYARVRIPCEVLVIDLLIREDTYGRLTPTAYARSEHYGELPYLRIVDEDLQLEPRNTVTYLGKGASVLYTGDVPGYSDLGRHIFDRIGSDASQFDVYRCRVEYPVLPSTAAITFGLPFAPQND